MSEKGTGKRFNSDKVRHELAPAYAQNEYAKVLTMGAEKYGAYNWQKGMDWSKVIASANRHLEAIKNGEDYDKESGLLHSAHLMCNAAFLTEYYKIYPEGDDRIAHMYSLPNIGLDIDGVLAAFSEGFLEYFDLDRNPAKHWNDPRFRNADRWKEIENNEEFWTGLDTLIHPDDLLFEPHCYITARSIPQEWTEKWLFEINNFPKVPVITVGRGESKVEQAKLIGVEVFVDDAYHNFKELNDNGIFTYLLTRSHNEKYDVGHRRLNSLNDVVKIKK